MNFGIPVTYRWVHTEVKAGLCVVRVSRERLGRMWPLGGACSGIVWSHRRVRSPTA
jgi:hypothetical protein